MRNRQFINLLLYPKYFASMAIPYKGKYLVRIRVFQKKVLNGKITFAYPQSKEFTDSKTLKHSFPSKVQINSGEAFYDTETFYLYYADQKISLNSYCIFKLQYDQLRQFKTFIEFELIRKYDSNVAQEGCMASQKQPDQNQTICKQIYVVNDYKRLDTVQRLYFEHHEFYCALDFYILTVSMGKHQRNNKFQLVQFCNIVTEAKKTKIQQKRCLPSLADLILSITEQVCQYCELRRILIKYQQTSKAKRSFLFQTNAIIDEVEAFQDLSHLKYVQRTYLKMPLHEALYQLWEQKQMINDNIMFLLSKLPRLIRIMPYPSFRALIQENIKKKYDLKKKYLIKKVPPNSSKQAEISINNIENIALNPHVNMNPLVTLTPRKSFQKSSENLTIEFMRKSCTFKENRKIQKQQFVHIRREQFIKAFKMINLKDCLFPMMLIQKSDHNLQKDHKEDKIVDSNNKNQKKQQKTGIQQTNLIILVHGYQGSHHDLKKLKNYLQNLNQSFKILAINSIQKSIDENIQFLGQKIASEIDTYISLSYEVIKCISFIGFSLGGVLARACLKHLSKYRQKMNLLMTLASPHLGVSESQNAFVNLGIWYLSKIDKVKNIKELNFQSVTQKDSFLMKLANGSQIGWFKKVVIVSSSQDEFVPHYSARLIGNTKNSYINQMAQKIAQNMRSCERIEVWFDTQKKSSFDKLIGRKSHIQFIENSSFLEIICKLYEQQF